MTQMRSRHYPNPYDFVPLEGAPELVPKPDHSRFSGISGRMSFVLEALTPLTINQDPSNPNQRRVYEFARMNSQPVVPATSLKGMLRSVHEIVTNSTLGLLKNEWYRRGIPAHYIPGEQTGRLTPTEALFGMVGGRADDSVGYAGRLLIDDIAIPAQTLRTIEIWRPSRGGMPKPEHDSFYFASGRDSTILGRKLYYHQDYRRVVEVYSDERRRASEPRTIEVVPGGGRLSGNLRFFNLSEDELAALVYTLILEDDLAHKLGYGKPLGLGSLRIALSKLIVEQEQDGLPSRLLSYGEEQSLVDRTADVAPLRQRAKDAWLHRPQGAYSYAAFAAITRWQTERLYIYPDYGFFLNDRRSPSKTTLWSYQGRKELYPGDQVSTASLVQAAPIRQIDAPDAPDALAVPPERMPAPPPEPRRVVDLRPIGAARHSDGKAYVEGIDGKRYLLTADSAQREVLRPILERLSAGETLRVRYRGERQKIDGKNVSVARDVELFEEATP